MLTINNTGNSLRNKNGGCTNKALPCEIQTKSNNVSHLLN